MEVHHSHHRGRKNFKEYLFEFFMIFLAVTAGFFAETIRESITNKEHEKEYIHSMIGDLKTDTSKLAVVVHSYQVIVKYQDSLLTHFSTLQGNLNTSMFRYLGSLEGYPDFIYTDGTMQQLKNSGGRLIRDRAAMDSILAYDAEVKSALINVDVLNKKFADVQSIRDEVINFQLLYDSLSTIKDPAKMQEQLLKMQKENTDILLTHDKVALIRFFNVVHNYSVLCRLVMKQMEHTKMKAIRLMQFLQKEYNTE